MGSHWSPHTGRAEVRKRIEAMVQPMPEHEVAAVDFDTRLGLGATSAKAVVTVVAVVALIVAVMVGCALGGDESIPGSSGASGIEELGDVPGAVGDGTAVASDKEEGNHSTAPGEDTEVSPTAADPCVVSVQGMVRAPGLLRLTASTRVGEAIDRAGGALPEASLLQINLAELVVDGMQIVVTKEGSHVVYPGGASSAGGAPNASGGAGAPQGSSGEPGGSTGAEQGSGAGNLVNINTADAAALETLDGVGPATAEAIIAWREDNGAFTTIEQLMEVRGIGPAKFEAMKNDVTV